LPALRVATSFGRSLVLSVERRTRTAVSIVRHVLEHLFDEGPLPRLQPSMGMDIVFALPGMGPSRRLVRARLGNLRVTPVSNDVMKRAATCLFIAAALGCSSGQNTDCRWPDESRRILDLRIDADASHLMQDVELAEELSVRFADESEFGPGPQRQRLRVERCYDPLVAGIMARQRGLRLPWVQHTFEYFMVALIAFLVIAVVSHRRAPLT